MAKKKSKSKGKNQQIHLSPERFMREKARTLPIGKCYITPGREESGLAQILVTRIRPSGNIVAGIFLVDTFCLGVKDATYRVNMDKFDFEEFLEPLYDGPGLEEITYEEAHNLIYGAISFAEEAGINPSKEFSIAGYILEEDTDDVPLIEYEFGKDGKHFLILDSDSVAKRYIPLLEEKLGDDFDYIFVDDEDDDEDFDYEDLKAGLENWKEQMAESARHPMEKYSYIHPDYPQTLSVKHQYIADQLLSPDNAPGLPREVIERILALPNDEVTEDLSAIIYYMIGQTYEAINDGIIGDIPYCSTILHAVMLLTQLRNEKGLAPLLEIMRQNDEFLDYHFGDIMPNVMHSALYACGKDNIPALEEYLYTPGYNSYFREQVAHTYAMIAFKHPERRGEIIELFRRMLVWMTEHLPQQYACDGTFAGLTLCYLIEMQAHELIPEIRALFATDCVDRSIAGGCDTVIEDMENGRNYIDWRKYEIPDIFEQFDRFRRMWEGNSKG